MPSVSEIATGAKISPNSYRDRRSRAVRCSAGVYERLLRATRHTYTQSSGCIQGVERDESSFMKRFLLVCSSLVSIVSKILHAGAAKKIINECYLQGVMSNSNCFVCSMASNAPPAGGQTPQQGAGAPPAQQPQGGHPGYPPQVSHPS